jgi:hypothetical protein
MEFHFAALADGNRDLLHQISKPSPQLRLREVIDIARLYVGVQRVHLLSKFRAHLVAIFLRAILPVAFDKFDLPPPFRALLSQPVIPFCQFVSHVCGTLSD